MNRWISQRNGGFTLIELMIVVAILTIAASLAVPAFIQWNTQSQLREATSEIATQLVLARMIAMNRNTSVDVTVQTATGVLHVSAITPSSGTVVIQDKTFPKQVPSMVGSPQTVSFSSLGLRTSGGTGTQSVGVCDAYKRQYSVSIAPSGKVNWSRNSTATSCP